MHRSPAPGEEEREFEAFAQTQNPLDIEAATWVTRRRNGLDAEGEAALQAWLDADPTHAAALEDMEDTFGEVQKLPEDEVASLKTGLNEQEGGKTTVLSPAPSRPANPVRRSWLSGLMRLFPQAAAAALVFGVAGGGWLGWDHWQNQPRFAEHYTTARGKQLAVSLPDADSGGSTLQLDTATRVEVQLYRDRRDVHLQDGQAMFTVHADAQRPFHVRAGSLRITVVGTRFSVRHTTSGLDAGQTVVAVEEGRVSVSTAESAEAGANAQRSPGGGTDIKGSDVRESVPAPRQPAITLTAGQMIAADANGQIGSVTVVSPTSVAAWRSGRISFTQTPLSAALAEFERYGPTGLVVRDPAVAAMPVGGSYSLQQFQRFADTLPEVLPVRLVKRGDVVEVVRR